MSTEITGLCNSVCIQCIKRQDMIEKYSQLVHLLKKKTQKQQDSRVKQITISQLTQSRSSTTYPLPTLSLLHLLEKLQTRRLQTSFTQLRVESICLTLPFIVDQPIIKQLKRIDAPPHSQQTQQNTLTTSLKTIHTLPPTQLSSIPSQARFLETGFKFKGSLKFFLHKIWVVERERDFLAGRVSGLETEIGEIVRRQQKEIAKKRQSLQGLAEQLGQKNELIEQLRESIKSLQVKLGTRDNQVLHRLLEQDGQILRRIIYQLENVNDKLNNQIAKIKNQKGQIDTNNKQLVQQVQRLREEVETMKQELFQKQHETYQNQLLRRQLEIMNQKLEGKMERVRRDEKKKNNFLKQQRHSQIEQKQENILYTQNINKLQQKIESIFSFLFNIQNHNNQLHKIELFDQEEQQLLLTHHNRFLSALKATVFAPLTSISHKHIIINGKQSDAPLFGDSFLQAFDQKVEAKKQNMKMLELQVQRSKLIERISELKQKHLHIRCVILQLLKSLQLRGMKKQTEQILSVLCDFFEYSEDERNAILQSKQKKFFGLL